MRIGIITSWMRLGWGVDLTLHMVGSALTAFGHEVTIYTANHDGSFARAPYKLVHTPVVPHKFFPRFEYRARRYIPFFNKEPNDIYLIATHPYFYYPWFLKKPVVNCEFGIVPTIGFSWRKKAMWAYMRLTQFYLYHPAADAIMSISEFTRRSLPWFLRGKTFPIYLGAEHYDPTHPDRDVLFPSPLLEPDPKDPSHPREVPVDKRSEEELRWEFREKHGFSKSDVVGLYVGRINPIDQPYKGTKELFEIVPKLQKEFPELKWVAVGLGTREDEELCKRSGILPLLNHPDWMMRQVYAGCDFYATASKWEGFNLPLVEAQYFGKPAVAYDVAAHPEVIEAGQTGFLAKDRADFEDKLKKLIRERELREHMGKRAREWAKKFNWRDCAKKVEQLFERILGK